MRGVNFDLKYSIYCSFVCFKKGTERMFTDTVNLFVTNSCFEWKKLINFTGIPDKEIMDLIHFRQEVAQSLY